MKMALKIVPPTILIPCPPGRRLIAREATDSPMLLIAQPAAFIVVNPKAPVNKAAILLNEKFLASSLFSGEYDKMLVRFD